MKFTNEFFGLMLIAATTTSSSATPIPTPGLCGDYSSNPIVVENICDSTSVTDAIIQKFEDTKLEDCPHFNDVDAELALIAGGSSNREARAFRNNIIDLCAEARQDAIDTIPTANWDGLTTIQDSNGEDIVLTDFFAGNGYLNTETGNFHQEGDQLNPNNKYYLGDDPRENDHYPTSDRSYHAAQSVRNFRATAAKNFLDAPTDKFLNCQNQAVMCCWGRDRQYEDANGACSSSNCKDKDPGDNTNLCYVHDHATGTPIKFNEASEGNIHCHGMAWSNDEDDILSKAKWNTLFYIAMSDHMHDRGYVGSVVPVIQDMCGCIEDMGPVSRSDCSKPVVAADYEVEILGPGTANFDILVVSTSTEIQFEQCRGDIFETTQNKNNDLSTHVNELHLANMLGDDVNGPIDGATMLLNIWDKIVGYRDPNDNDNEIACKGAYEFDYPNDTY